MVNFFRLWLVLCLVSGAAVAQPSSGGNGISNGGTASKLVTFSGSPTGISVTNAATLAGGGAFSGTFTGAHTYSGAVTLSGGGTLSGTFAGTPTWSGQPIFSAGFTFQNGSGGAGTLTTSSNWGALLQGRSGAVADVGLQSSDGNVAVRVLNGGGVQIGSGGISSTSNTQTLSGSQTGTRVANFNNSLAGSTSAAQISLSNIGSASDALAMSSGSLSMFNVNDSMGAGWNGSRVGISIGVADTAATTLTNGNKVGISPVVTTSFNEGGISSGFGTTQFGVGTNFGGVFQVQMAAGATFASGQTGVEVDISSLTGSSLANQIGLQIVHSGSHAVQGTVADIGMRFGDGPSVTAGWRDAMIAVGSWDSKFPASSTAVALQLRTDSQTNTMAGGMDLLEVALTGAGANGGGYAIRTQGASSSVSATAIDAIGGIKMGSAYVSASASALTLDTGLFAYVGIGSIVSGGTGYSNGDLVDDGYGNVFTTTVSAGVVTSLTLKYRGEGKISTPAVSSLAFNTMTRNGAALGSGLTVTESAWTKSGTTLNLGTTTATTIGIGNAGSTTTITGAIKAGSSTGQTQTCTVNQAKTLIFTNGILTGGTCNT